MLLIWWTFRWLCFYVKDVPRCTWRKMWKTCRDTHYAKCERRAEIQLVQNVKDVPKFRQGSKSKTEFMQNEVGKPVCVRGEKKEELFFCERRALKKKRRKWKKKRGKKKKEEKKKRAGSRSPTWPLSEMVARPMRTNLLVKGWVSTDRSEVAALLITTPRPRAKSSTNDLSPPRRMGWISTEAHRLHWSAGRQRPFRCGSTYWWTQHIVASRRGGAKGIVAYPGGILT